ncbi:sugar phosphate isomerase/epimerase family protein [Paenibacillus thermotolerans]|uniref:sugar phosphate isomerase/epimerase family protein n=1 Tax=Paenibacillus thermotolerans TaxID=3027807 RepID=UPI00236771CC|nr:MULTISPECIES: sugar phosphate isomerase/epimerase [unclassified Paenibacillus]
MKLLWMKALWGMEGGLEANLERIAEAGYDGVEAPLPEERDRGRFQDLLRQYNLSYIGMAFTGGPDHTESLRSQLKELAPLSPLSVTAHSGKDSFTWEEQRTFFEGALQLESEFGFPIGHETHRQRSMFTPWTTARLLREFDGLKITADFSHWLCVCESHLQDHADDIALAISRTLHLHTRVGHPEGPQVNHPAAPEWKTELDLHVGWWKEVVRQRREEGREYLTITPEFGPVSYMPALPFTRQPVADLWEVCLWMKRYLESELV